MSYFTTCLFCFFSLTLSPAAKLSRRPQFSVAFAASPLKSTINHRGRQLCKIQFEPVCSHLLGHCQIIEMGRQSENLAIHLILYWKDLNSVNKSQNLTARPKLRFEFWQNSSKSSSDWAKVNLELYTCAKFWRCFLDQNRFRKRMCTADLLDTWNITGPINVQESEIDWFDWSVKKLGSKVGPDSVFLLLTWCPSAPLAAK